MRADVDRPLIVVGCPRAGLSLLVELLAAHPSLGWISHHTDKAPRMPWWAPALQRLYATPVVGKRLYGVRLGRSSWVAHRLPYPVEPWQFWESRVARYTPKTEGLWLPEPPTEADVLPAEVDRVRQDISWQLAMQGRPRLLSYHGGHARIRLLSAIFSDARFVHIVRDGRAVCESWRRMIEVGGFRTWDERDRWPRVWPEPWRRRFQEAPTPFTLCVYLWMHFTNQIRSEARTHAPGRVLELRYEDLADRPRESLGRVLEFAELPRSRRLDWIVRRVPPTNNDAKWKKALREHELRAFDEIVEDPALRALLAS